MPFAESPPLKVCLPCISHRGVDPRHMFARDTFLEECWQQGIEVRRRLLYGSGFIAKARSDMLLWFLETDCDVLLFLDDDIGFIAEDAIRLVRAAPVYGVIAGLYVMRTLQESDAPLALFRDQKIEFHPNAPPVAVRYVPMGFTAISREVAQQVVDSMRKRGVHEVSEGQDRPLAFAHVLENEVYLSEDYSFCSRVRLLGLPVYLDPSIRLWHFGAHAYSQDDFLRTGTPRLEHFWLSREEKTGELIVEGEEGE